MNRYQPHEFADIFPTLSDDDFRLLMADIAAQGLHEPIILFENKILDGRNRYEACRQLGIEPTFKQFEGTEVGALELVMSKNLHRRHLTPAQRAAAMAEFADTMRTRRMIEADETDAIREDAASFRMNSDENSARRGRPKTGDVLATVAKAGNVGRDTVAKARRVKKKAPELFQAVKNGNLSLNVADKVAALPEEQRAEVIAAGPEAMKAAAAEQRKAAHGSDQDVQDLKSAVDVLAQARDEHLHPLAAAMPNDIKQVRDAAFFLYKLGNAIERPSRANGSASKPSSSGGLSMEEAGHGLR